MSGDYLDRVLAAQTARSAAIQDHLAGHLATYPDGARGPNAADLAEWLHRETGFFLTPSGVRGELAEMIRTGEVSRHKAHGSWRYALERDKPYRLQS